MDLTNGNVVVSEQKESESQSSPVPAYVDMVDPFLVEALQNPRHRLTILRMELDVQKFLRNPDEKQFEFPHFPTSYLRLAAHRVAQHYGLQTLVQENVVDGQGNKILVIKKPESKFPTVCLSDVPSKDLESGNLDRIKIVIRPRPKLSANNSDEMKLKNQVRTIEERKEDYDKARARIFSSASDGESEDASVEASSDAKKLNLGDNGLLRNTGVDGEKSLWSRESNNSSRVAILRDIEKDRFDPDYDRSYDRYARSCQSFNMAPFNIQTMLPPLVQYDPSFPQEVQTTPPQAHFNYRIPVSSPYSVTGFTQNSGEALVLQWPMQSVVYPQAYDQSRHGFFQAPFYQQPLSFDYSQNYHR